MNKILSTKKLNAVFLAAVLVAGTFALMSSSFMNSAQAEPGYDKPQQYPSYKPDYNYKSKDTIGIKKVNCNNVNLNVNDVSVNVGRPPVVGDFTSLDTSSTDETGEQEITANNFASGERPNNGFMKDKDGFVYVCVNNNNNAGQGEQCAEADDIKACFDEFISELQFERLTAALESEAGIAAEINGEDVTLRSFADICEAFKGLTYEQIRSAVGVILSEITPPPQIPVISSELIDCIAEALGIPAQGPG